MNFLDLLPDTLEGFLYDEHPMKLYGQHTLADNIRSGDAEVAPVNLSTVTHLVADLDRGIVKYGTFSKSALNVPLFALYGFQAKAEYERAGFLMKYGRVVFSRKFGSKNKPYGCKVSLFSKEEDTAYIGYEAASDAEHVGANRISWFKHLNNDYVIRTDSGPNVSPLELFQQNKGKRPFGFIIEPDGSFPALNANDFHKATRHLFFKESSEPFVKWIDDECERVGYRFDPQRTLPEMYQRFVIGGA